MDNFEINLKLEEALVISEYESLREEINARLTRVFRLQQGLLLGTLIYATTFLPKLLDSNPLSQPAQSLSTVALLYYSFLFILPFIAFVVELICTSEQDAISRAGIYIKENIEKIYRQSTFRGWEDWLDRQDKRRRRRTSDKLIIFARRYVIIPLYCFSSSLICTIGFITSLKVKLDFYLMFLSVVGVFMFYMANFSLMVYFLKRAQKDELSSPLYNLLVLDVDGCLLNRDKKISKANKEAILFLKKRGIDIILASGRGALSLQHICKKLNLKGLHVICHGASIFDASNNIERQLNACLSNDDLKIIIRKLNELSITWVVFGKNKYYCMERDVDAVKANLVSRADISSDESEIVTGVQDDLIFEWSEKISKILCYVNVDETKKRSELDEALSNHFKVMMSTDETLEIVHQGALKEKAVKEIIKNYGPKDIRSIVVGDYDNDIGILKWGQQAVAPSNASMGVRKLKGVNMFEITNDEDLIWEIARAYFNLRAIKPIEPIE